MRQPRFDRVLPALCALLLAVSGTRAQTNGVDLTLSGQGASFGAPCTVFTTVHYFPFVPPASTYKLTVYAAPGSPYFLLLGPPPTSFTTIPGIANQLLIHAPVIILASGAVSAGVVTTCGEGSASLPLFFPPGPMGGFDFAIQALSISSVTGGLAFTRGLWITYL